MLQLYYQYYFELLKDFTFAEKVIIARIYLVISILKFRLNNSFNLRLYKGICKYFVFLPKNSRPFFNLLPLETTSAKHIVRII